MMDFARGALVGFLGFFAGTVLCGGCPARSRAAEPPKPGRPAATIQQMIAPTLTPAPEDDDPEPIPDANAPALEIEGLSAAICGEIPEFILLEKPSAVPVKSRDWRIRPAPSRVFYGKGKLSAAFSSSEPATYQIDVVTVDAEFTIRRASWVVRFEHKGEIAAASVRLQAVEESDDPADLVAQWLAEVDGATQFERQSVGSAMLRACNAADRGLLSPYAALGEARAMAAMSLRASAGIERWEPFFDHIGELFGELEEAGAFQEPRKRVEALRSVAQVVNGG